MKTHQERAERAADLVGSPSRSSVDLIAEETRPTELLKAARGLCEEIESGPKHTGMTGEHLRRVRAALALYGPEAENG